MFRIVRIVLRPS